MKKAVSSDGFTLVELVVVLATVLVLVSVSAPSFSNFFLRSQLNSGADKLFAAFNFARGMAANQNKIVVVCSGNQVDGCSDDWASNVIVFSDNNRSDSFDNGDDLLRTAIIDGELQTDFRLLSYDGSGFMREPSSTLVFCKNQMASGLTLLKSGPMLIDYDSAGLPLDMDGGVITCNQG
jgi:prepilin-type N-terminal cleavage/methylation domain-containing protein